MDAADVKEPTSGVFRNKLKSEVDKTRARTARSLRRLLADDWKSCEGKMESAGEPTQELHSGQGGDFNNPSMS
jgi:hypothetical protein